MPGGAATLLRTAKLRVLRVLLTKRGPTCSTAAAATLRALAVRHGGHAMVKEIKMQIASRGTG